MNSDVQWSGGERTLLSHVIETCKQVCSGNLGYFWTDPLFPQIALTTIKIMREEFDTIGTEMENQWRQYFSLSADTEIHRAYVFNIHLHDIQQ